jgi:hypothetical protein
MRIGTMVRIRCIGHSRLKIKQLESEERRARGQIFGILQGDEWPF